MPVLLNASRRWWMADREIGVPGGRWPQRAQAGVPALPNAHEVSSVQLLFNLFVHALIGGGGVGFE